MKYNYRGETRLDCPVFHASNGVQCDEIVLTGDDVMKILVARNDVDRNRFFDWLQVQGTRFIR